MKCIMRHLLSAGLILFSSYSLGHTQLFTLDNGLKILVQEDHRAPIVVSMIWYNVGSADEPGGITGVSHALEHLMFKGTKKNPLGVFSKKITALGGEINAMTNNDYTAYYEKTAAMHLATSFELEADRMQHLLWDKDEFSKEIKVIQEERRSRISNNPQALALERFLAAAHLSAPYHHPVIGWMSDLEQMDMLDAKTWYQRFYAPNNATLVVVGDVAALDVYALAKRYFGALSPRPQRPRKAQIEPPTYGKKIVHVHTAAKLPVLMLGYTVPTVKTASTESAAEPYALEIIAGILSGGDSGRFNKGLEHGTQIASDTGVYYNLYARYQTQFVLYAIPSRAHTLHDLNQAIHQEITRLQKEPVSQQELHRVKIQIIAQKTFERDSIFSQAMELGLLQTIGLGAETAAHYVDRINGITSDQIQNVAQRYFQDNRLTEAQLTPKRPLL